MSSRPLNILHCLSSMDNLDISLVIGLSIMLGVGTGDTGTSTSVSYRFKQCLTSSDGGQAQ